MLVGLCILVLCVKGIEVLIGWLMIEIVSIFYLCVLIVVLLGLIFVSEVV